MKRQLFRWNKMTVERRGAERTAFSTQRHGSTGNPASLEFDSGRVSVYAVL